MGRTDCRMAGFILGAALAAALTAEPALAQQPDPAPWDGFTIGIAAGFSAGQDDIREINGPRRYFADLSGGDFAVRGGWQTTRSGWLIGAEVEAGYLGAGGSVSRLASGESVGSETDLGLYGALTARAGYLVTPDWLVFVRGGGIISALSAKTDQRCQPAPCGITASRAATEDATAGFLLGAGVELRLSDRWSARAEYSYIDFRKELALPPAAGPGWDHHLDLHQVRVGLSYRF